MARKARVDAELVRRGLARSRHHAAELITAGRVAIPGILTVKPATGVSTDMAITVRADEHDPDWASRGGYKLAGALERFEAAGLTVAGKRCLDAGASTGGFTDVLLRREAREVVAVDVGYGQLLWRLRDDPRVRVHDRTNIRYLSTADIDGPVELIVADVSFISLKLVLPVFSELAAAGADVLPMVKPQFEVGKAQLGSGGVVRDSAARQQAVFDVVRAAAELGLGLLDVVASPLPGPSGNVEFFAWLRSGVDTDVAHAEELISQAITASTTSEQTGAGHGLP